MARITGDVLALLILGSFLGVVLAALSFLSLGVAYLIILP